MLSEIYLIKVYTWRLTIEISLNLHVYFQIFQISSVKSELWLYISQTIFWAMEGNYMQNDQAEHSFLGTYITFLGNYQHKRIHMKRIQIPYPYFLWEALDKKVRNGVSIFKNYLSTLNDWRIIWPCCCLEQSLSWLEISRKVNYTVLTFLIKKKTNLLDPLNPSKMKKLQIMFGMVLSNLYQTIIYFLWFCNSLINYNWRNGCILRTYGE